MIMGGKEIIYYKIYSVNTPDIVYHSSCSKRNELDAL